jgi:hypothetical protein
MGQRDRYGVSKNGTLYLPSVPKIRPAVKLKHSSAAGLFFYISLNNPLDSFLYIENISGVQDNNSCS